MVRILLMLWGFSGRPGKHANSYEFRPNDVMRLGAQIRANLTIPHQLVVVTDYPRNLFPSELEYVPLLDHFADVRPLNGCWLRLKCFAPELQSVTGDRFCWIDLDSVVTGPLDPLIDRPESLVLFKSDSLAGTRWNGSFVLATPEKHRDIWTKFDPERTPFELREVREANGVGPRGTDQAWLHTVRGPETAHVSAIDGVIAWSVARCRKLPENARLVTFPGSMKMSDPRVLRQSPWLERYYWAEGFDPAKGLPVAERWPVVGNVSPARHRKSVIEMRIEARRELRKMRARAQ